MVLNLVAKKVAYIYTCIYIYVYIIIWNYDAPVSLRVYFKWRREGGERKKTRLKVRSSRLVAFTKGPILLFKRIRDETKVGGWNKRDFLLMHLRKGRELEMWDSCVCVRACACALFVTEGLMKVPGVTFATGPSCRCDKIYPPLLLLPYTTLLLLPPAFPPSPHHRHLFLGPSPFKTFKD